MLTSHRAGTPPISGLSACRRRRAGDQDHKTPGPLVGDGTYLFGVPASAQWVARRYNLPSLTVIYDNRGWKSPKLSTVGVHRHGVAAQHNDFGVSFTPEADLPGIARAASGAWARTVSRADELPAAVKDAFAAVRAGQPAVLSAHLPDA